MQVTQKGRDQRIFGVIRITTGIILKKRLGQSGVFLLILFIILTLTAQIHPGGDGNDPAGHGKMRLLQFQCQGIAKPASGAFAAERDLVVAFTQQIPISFQRVLHRRGEGCFRR